MTTLIKADVDRVAENKTVMQLMVESNFLPKMTTAARDLLTDLATGIVIYNTTTNKLNVRVAAAWEAVTSA